MDAHLQGKVQAWGALHHRCKGPEQDTVSALWEGQKGLPGEVEFLSRIVNCRR